MKFEAGQLLAMGFRHVIRTSVEFAVGIARSMDIFPGATAFVFSLWLNDVVPPVLKVVTVIMYDVQGDRRSNCADVVVTSTYRRRLVCPARFNLTL